MAIPKIRTYKRGTETAMTAFDEMNESADLAQIRKNIRRLRTKIKRLESDRLKMEQAGIIDGYVQFKDKKYMVIYTQQVGGKREREYIGVDPDHQKLATEAIERYKEWKSINYKIDKMEKRCQRINRQLIDLLGNTDPEKEISFGYSF